MPELLFSANDRPVVAQELYIVTDKNDKELMVMPFPAILRQKLFFRRVMLALINKERQLMIQKAPLSHKIHPGKWDVFSAPVKMSYSREDTARELLREGAGIHGELKLKLRANLLPFPQDQPYSIVLYTARPAAGEVALAAQRNDIMLADKDELNGLMEGDPAMFSPALLEIQRQGLIYPE